jgi:hypothetical protein
MRRVRDRLKELDYKLYESLVRSHEIAWNEWLPALSVQQDSYNSFPHIRNLEMYLDTIVTAYEENSKREFFISAVEMYIILAAILFHDIGKINKKDGKPDIHASESSLIICGNSVLVPRGDKTVSRQYKNDKVWASLGIPSYELALSIGKICEYHDIDKVKDEAKRKALRNILTSICIDAYGEVRQKALAALLTLVDHLDNTHTRIMPEYLRGAGEIKVVGAFRRVITGVYIDLKMHIVRTVLNETLPDGTEAEINNYKLNHDMKTDAEWEHLCSMLELYPAPDNRVLNFEKKDRAMKITLKGEKKELIRFFKTIPEKFSEYKAAIGQRTKIPESLEQLFKTIEDCLDTTRIKYYFINGFFNSGNASKRPIYPDLIDILIINDVLRAEIKNEESSSGENRIWPQRILQDVILGNVSANNDALSLIKSDLESLEIPISAWLIDHREHLYNCRGEETFEPVFSKSYLCEVALRMWEISTQVFGVSNFTYENLAAMMREPDTQKVKMAVRRISVITSSAPGKNGESSILSGDTSWKWMVDNSDKPCICLNIHEVNEILEKAGEPNEK